MKRALCVWLPQWPLQRLAAARAELKPRAVLLYRLHASAGAQVVAYCPRLASAAAALWDVDPRRGAAIRPGMPLAEATALAGYAASIAERVPPLARPARRAGGQRKNMLTKREHGTLKASGTVPILRSLRSKMGLSPSSIRADLAKEHADEMSAPIFQPTGPPHLEMADPLADRVALEELAHWCQRFSPTVALEEGEEPESLLFDVTGLGRLVGGEQALAETIVREFRQRDLTVRVAIADTLGAAWALAHFAELPLAATSGFKTLQVCHCLLVKQCNDQQSTVRQANSGTQSASPVGYETNSTDPTAILSALGVPLIAAEGCTEAALAPLPVEALRLPAEICAVLSELGLRRIDQLAALPRATLSARFGTVVLDQLDRASGAAAEAIAARRAPAELEFAWPFEHPTARREMIEFALDHLVARACGALARERRGILRLGCRFEYENHPATHFVVGLYRPSACPRHVGDLVRLKLERLRFREPLAAIRATVLALDLLEFHQQEMFCQPSQPGLDDPRRLAALVDRLSNRLGSQAVVRPWLLASAQPEFACQYQPLASLAARRPRNSRRPQAAGAIQNSAARGKKRGGRPTQPLVPGDRPLHLEPEPRRLSVMSLAPEGPPMQFRLAGREERIVRIWGPERIESGWWRTRLVRRDYYQVETAHGGRYWLFRDLAGGAWFLHGEFA